MDQILKPIQCMKATYLLAASILMIVNTPFAQATIASYDVTGVFVEPQTQPINTTFNGSFEWDGAIVTNFHGTMNSSMWETDDISPIPGVSYPLMNLNYQLSQSVDGDIVTANVFLENSTDVFMFGGYTAGDTMKYGTSFGPDFEDGNTPNENAYFSFAFDKTTMTGILDEMVYGDCTAGGLMGQLCMTGHSIAKVGFSGTMAGVPESLTISEVSAVPVPTAAWLFGTALAGMIGVSRKRIVAA